MSRHKLPKRATLSVEQLAKGVEKGNTALLARAITLIESNAQRHHKKARGVLDRLLAHNGKAIRVGISGVPGVGKSTFIERFGLHLLDRGHRVAVLAIDPTSRKTGGSILGDKTRMNRLSQDKRAFIRPSPSSGHLGGVHRKTRETAILCEAAGYDVILIETVGVGQSETLVADMVDTYLVLMLAGAGDELQGIKKGILEVADIVAINKADGENLANAKRAQRDYAHAFHFLAPRASGWKIPVLTCSALLGEGLAELWAAIIDHRELLREKNLLDAKRQAQKIQWMWALVLEQLEQKLRNNPRVKELQSSLEESVRQGSMTPTSAAELIFGAFESGLE